jgi:hypothetical protein
MVAAPRRALLSGFVDSSHARNHAVMACLPACLPAEPQTRLLMQRLLTLQTPQNMFLVMQGCWLHGLGHAGLQTGHTVYRSQLSAQSSLTNSSYILLLGSLHSTVLAGSYVIVHAV